MGEQMQLHWVWKSRARLDEQATFVQSNLRASDQTQQEQLIIPRPRSRVVTCHGEMGIGVGHAGSDALLPRACC
jgi:hypothetical protein